MHITHVYILFILLKLLYTTNYYINKVIKYRNDKMYDL